MEHLQFSSTAKFLIFIITCIAGLILFVRFFFHKLSSSTTDDETIKNLPGKITSSAKFTKWLKNRLETDHLSLQCFDANHLKSHIQRLIFKEWLIEFHTETSKTIALDDIPNVAEEITQFLLKTDKISFIESTSC